MLQNFSGRDSISDREFAKLAEIGFCNADMDTFRKAVTNLLVRDGYLPKNLWNETIDWIDKRE